MSFHSQFGEDAWVSSNILLPPGGVFIEVGAFDGALCSNTLWLEEKGWTGLVIEPDPIMAARCRETRRCQVIEGAAGSWNGTGTFNVNTADRGMSGLDRPGVPTKVEVFRLDRLISLAGLAHVDVLSVDTEGTELDVLEGLGNHVPYVLICEFWTQPKPPNPEPVLKWALAHGMTEVHRTVANLIFARGVWLG